MIPYYPVNQSSRIDADCDSDYYREQVAGCLLHTVKYRLYRYCMRLFLLVFFTQCFVIAKAQQDADYTIHANIIYHFTKYINWPPAKKSGDFIIGVVGDTPLFSQLKKNIEGKMAGDQRIVIQRFSSSAGSFSCHILFVSDEASDEIKKIAAKTAGSSLLLVSESEGLAKKGSCINFIIVSDRIKLEINKNNIEQRNLGIASELLALGKIVR